MNERLIRIKEVIERTGLSRSTIYARAQAGEFPKPVPLGNSLSAWVESEVQEWIANRIRARDAATPTASTAVEQAA
jgi:prophage regulatory protein